jgi:hypothetical protein
VDGECFVEFINDIAIENDEARCIQRERNESGVRFRHTGPFGFLLLRGLDSEPRTLLQFDCAVSRGIMQNPTS